jgi:hypothetical protein
MLPHPGHQLVPNVFAAVSKEHQSIGVQPVPLGANLPDYHLRLPPLVARTQDSRGGRGRGSLDAFLNPADTSNSVELGVRRRHNQAFCFPFIVLICSEINLDSSLNIIAAWELMSLSRSDMMSDSTLSSKIIIFTSLSVILFSPY